MGKLWWIAFLGLLFALNVFAVTSSNRTSDSQEPVFHFVLVKYEGGAWETHSTYMKRHIHEFIPHFLNWFARQKIMSVSQDVKVLSLSDQKIFNYPILYLLGHGVYPFSDQEKENLKAFIERGGFLFVDDFNTTDRQKLRVHSPFEWAPFSKSMLDLFNHYFPKGKMILYPVNHPINQFPFPMPRRRPSGIDDSKYNPERDDRIAFAGKGGEFSRYGQSFDLEGRAIAHFTDGWQVIGSALSVYDDEDKPYKMFANLFVYVMTH